MQTKTVFICQSCGSQSPKWLGRCPECDEWNSFVEESLRDNGAKGVRSVIADIVSSDAPKKLSAIEQKDLLRTNTQIGELDRVLGGGLVKGSAILVGGEPGIGKSTLMLQAANVISKERRVLYVSGEESLSQIKLRAQRLGLSSENLYIVNETDLVRIIEHIKDIKPYMAVIDSIQTTYCPQF
ncbi:MAG: ATPase domain-containing protein, partial [Candidatus Orphnella occulta]|nr:ATPase domain-containing protein [Candidatus Orphnella occulta]